MPYFRYKLIESSGRVSSGVLNLPYDNETAVSVFLERDGNTVLFVKRLRGLASTLLDLSNAGKRRRIKRAELAEFLANLSVMLRSGMPVTTAMQELADDADNPALANAAQGMLFYLESGSSLSDAARRYPGAFPDTVLYLIRIGEETGSLENTLRDASEHLRRIERIISDTKQALLYPGFVFVAMGAALVFWFYYVVPKIVGLFAEMNVAMPGITLALLAMSDFLQKYAVHILVGLAALVAVTVVAYRRSRRFRHGVHRLMLRTPVVRDIVATSSLAFISEYMRLLLNSGVDTFRAMEVLQGSLGNEVFKEKVGVIRDNLTNGVGVSESFRAAQVFPSFVVRMIGVGEQSGTLPEQLAYVAEEYQRRLAVIVATIGKVIEPLVLIIAGVMFAVIIIGLFLPIYDLISQVA